MTVAWIATITDLLCALFLNLALLCHVVAREERRPWIFVTSLVFFLIAFASKETAAIYPVIVGAYEFFFADRLGGEEYGLRLAARIKLTLRSWWAWAIPLRVFSGYMAFYRSLLPYRGEPTIWFSLVVFAFALLPGLATDPGERLLYYPSVFGFFPVAWMILQIPALKRRFIAESPAGRRLLGPIWG